MFKNRLKGKVIYEIDVQKYKYKIKKHKLKRKINNKIANEKYKD